MLCCCILHCVFAAGPQCSVEGAGGCQQECTAGGDCIHAGRQPAAAADTGAEKVVMSAMVCCAHGTHMLMQQSAPPESVLGWVSILLEACGYF